MDDLGETHYFWKHPNDSSKTRWWLINKQGFGNFHPDLIWGDDPIWLAKRIFLFETGGNKPPTRIRKHQISHFGNLRFLTLPSSLQGSGREKSQARRKGLWDGPAHISWKVGGNGEATTSVTVRSFFSIEFFQQAWYIYGTIHFMLFRWYSSNDAGGIRYR